MLNLAEKAVKYATRIGADEAEAYISKQRAIIAEIERGDISSECIQEIGGIGIRAIKDGSVGFSYLDKLDERRIREAAESSYHIARASVKDPYVALPHPKKLPSVKGVYDGRIADLQVEECVEMTKTMLESALNYDKRVRVDMGRFEARIEEEAIVNSKGISAVGRGTFVSGILMTLAREKEEVSSFAYEFGFSRNLDVDPQNIGVTAAEKAIGGLGAKTVESFEGTVLLDFSPSTTLISNVLAFGINSENVQRDASPLKEKIGNEIAVPEVNIIDDGLLDSGMATKSFDDEGLPRRRTTIIEEGVLKCFLFNHYTGTKEGGESTGNASRRGGGLFFGAPPPFESTPHVLPSNLILEPGTKSWEDLRDEIDKGIVVGRFSGNVEASNGYFSGVIKQGFLVERGEIKHSLVGTMISGNTYHLLKRISGISKEVKDVESYRTPMIRIENVKITGKT